MTDKRTCDVLVIGGGPAGLAASIAAHDAGADVLLIEREQRLGGILKQCIHDGFGLVRFKEKLSGPEYAERFIDEFGKRGITALLQTFVTDVKKTADGFETVVVDREGVHTIAAKSMVLRSRSPSTAPAPPASSRPARPRTSSTSAARCPRRDASSWAPATSASSWPAG